MGTKKNSEYYSYFNSFLSKDKDKNFFEILSKFTNKKSINDIKNFTYNKQFSSAFSSSLLDFCNYYDFQLYSSIREIKEYDKNKNILLESSLTEHNDKKNKIINNYIVIENYILDNRKIINLLVNQSEKKRIIFIRY